MKGFVIRSNLQDATGEEKAIRGEIFVKQQ